MLTNPDHTRMGPSPDTRQYEVESDAELAMFNPAQKFAALELAPGADQLNPFSVEGYEEQGGEETYNETTPQTQLDPSIPDTIELKELVDHQTVQKNRIDTTVDLGDGKHVHKAKVLCEFTRFTRISNSTDHLR